MQQGGDDGGLHAQYAGGRQCRQREGEPQPDSDIDVNRSAAAAAETHAGAQAPQIVGHQREVGRGHGDIGSLRAHGDPDGSGAQGERVIDAVADDHGAEPQFDLFHHVIHLLFRQHLRIHRRYADLRGNLMRHRGPVAGQQHEALDTQFLQITGPRRLRSSAVHRGIAASPRTGRPR